MSLIIKNISLLLENDLEFINCGYIVIGKDGLISHAGQGDFRNTNKHERYLMEKDYWHVQDS